MGYSEDMAQFIQYRAGNGNRALDDIELAMLTYRLVVGGGVTSGGGGSTGGTGSGTVSIKDRALTQIFTIATGGTQSDWFTINSDSKLLLLEVPAMTGTSLQIRWRHPVTTGVANPIVDAFGAPISLTIGATGRIFSSDALAPLARCVLGDGEISFVSNVAEGAQRLIKLYY